MIEEMVDIFSGIVQLLIVAVVAAGAYIGYAEIPDAFHIGKKLIEPAPFVKALIGGGVSFLLAAIFLGPALVLLDMRNAIRSIDKKTKT